MSSGVGEAHWLAVLIADLSFLSVEGWYFDIIHLIAVFFTSF